MSSQELDKPRVALLVNRPIPYYATAFRALAERPELDTCVYYWDIQRDGVFESGYGRHVRWKDDLLADYHWWSPPIEAADWRRHASILKRLKQDRPSAMLCFGWASPVARLGAIHAAYSGTPMLLYGDSNWRTPSRSPKIRRLMLHGLFRVAYGAVSTGGFNREFYIAHGMDPAVIHPGVYPVDLRRFAASAERNRPTADRTLIITYAGRLIEIKAVDDLIEAVAQLPSRQHWQLWIAGDGPHRASLEALVRKRDLGDRVRFLGFKNTDELPEIMRSSDIFVLPSRQEPRGQVAVEAMAAGAAVVVSTATGAWGPGDAIDHGRTGLVFPAGDIAALSGCLSRLIDDHALRARLAAAAVRAAETHGPQVFADTVVAALARVTRGERYAPYL